MQDNDDKKKPTQPSGAAKQRRASAGVRGTSTRSGATVSARDKRSSLKQAKKATSGSSTSPLWLVAAALVLALVIAGVIAVISKEDRPDGVSKETVAEAVEELRDELPDGIPPSTLDPSGVVRIGDPAAPATVEFWVDMLCPACKNYEEHTADVVRTALVAGNAKLAVYPVAILDDATEPQGYSTRAAQALMCAADRGQGYEYLILLGKFQPAEGSAGLSEKELLAIGSGLGLDGSFTTCVKNAETANFAALAMAAFQQRQFPGTPTILVNGTRLTGGMDTELKAAIDKVVAGQQPQQKTGPSVAPTTG